MFNLLLKKNELIKQKPSNIKTYKMKIKLVKAPKLQNNVGKVHEACYQLIELNPNGLIETTTTR